MKDSDTDQFAGSLQRWIVAVMRRTMHEAVAYAGAKGLSSSQIGALFLVYDRGVCTVGEISHAVGVSMAGATQLVDRLVSRELVNRSEDPNNRRSKRIELTRRGTEFLEEMMNLRKGWIGDLASSFSTPERMNASRLFDELASRIEGDEIR